MKIFVLIIASMLGGFSSADAATCVSQLMRMGVLSKQATYVCVNSRDSQALVKGVIRLVEIGVPAQKSAFQVFELQERNENLVPSHVSCVERAAAVFVPVQHSAYSCFQCALTNVPAKKLVQCLEGAAPKTTQQAMDANLNCFNYLRCQ
jgi:hypothetical protein